MGLFFCESLLSFLSSFYFPVLHPRHKLPYFKMAGWAADWIDTAQDLVRHEFEFTYA